MTDELTLEAVEWLEKLLSEFNTLNTSPLAIGQARRSLAFELIRRAPVLLSIARAHIEAKGGDVGELAAFGASEAACIYYPGEDQELLRDAFCRGAGHAASALAAKEAEIVRLRISLSNMVEDGDETDRQEAIALLGRAK